METEGGRLEMGSPQCVVTGRVGGIVETGGGGTTNVIPDVTVP